MNKKIIILLFLSITFLFLTNLCGKALNLLDSKNWILISKNKKGEKIFYEKDSFKRLSNSKINLNLLYLPSDNVSQRCENYWINWFSMSEYREVLWIGIPKEEKERCKRLKYSIYKGQIDCKNRTFKVLDFTWYDNEGNPVYTRKSVGISFLSIPEELIEVIFNKFCAN